MTPTKLPHELLSLVHHVELNQTEWWNKAIQQVIISAMWLVPTSLTEQGIVDAVHETFSTDIAPERVASQIQELLASKTLVSLQDGTLKISESSLNEFERGLETVEENEREAKAKFLELLEKFCPSISPDECWEQFNTKCLIPLVRQFGARTYELFSGSSQAVDWEVQGQVFFDGYPSDVHVHLQTLIAEYLDPKSLAVRSYVLRYLNAYFFIEATGLKEETLDKIAELRGKNLTLSMFLDTNFLFSVLNLHENPSNETARLLLELLKRLPKYISVKLYVFPLTMDETRRVLTAVHDNLKGVNITPNIAEAVRSGAIPLHGISLRFVQACESAGVAINPDDYFKPYLSNLQAVLRQNGIEMYNQKVDDYLSDQRVTNDLLERYEYENPDPRDQQRRYNAIRHDMALWHFAHDKRAGRIESPLEANFWVVTNDFAFLGFDARKRRNANEGIPVCIHPTAFIQMLQFWEPRTIEFDEALLGSLRLPFLFPEFDTASERVTLDILKALARFEKVGDLSVETVAEVLIDNAVRQNISAAENSDQIFDLVDSALIEGDKQTRVNLQTARDQVEQLQTQVAEHAEAPDSFQEQLDTERKAVNDLEARLSKEREKRESVEVQVDGLQQALERETEKAIAQEVILRFTLNWVLIPLAIVVAVAIVGAILIDRYADVGTWRVGLGLGLLAGLPAMMIADFKGQRSSIISSLTLVSKFHRFKNFVLAVMVAIIASMIGGALWDELKGFIVTVPPV